MEQRKKIQVIYPDGRLDCQDTVAETYRSAIKYMGLEAVRALGIKRNSINIVSTRDEMERSTGMHKEDFCISHLNKGNELGICTEFSTEDKYKYLVRINKALSAGLQIRLVDATDSAISKDNKYKPINKTNMNTNNTMTQEKTIESEIKRIAEAGKYDAVKYVTNPEAPTDCFMAIGSRGGKDYLVDHSGEDIREVFEADELRANLGSVTPATFRSGDKWGIVNSKGEVILDAKYDSVMQDANDFVFLTLNGKEGFIAGGHVFEPQFDSVRIGDDEYIEVSLNGAKGYIDENDEFTTDRSEAYYHMMMFLD
ncbi:MAG: WG repeat-containing protein [Muribaculaceae bacterium]|nr:WG repeat-containing protein [Muribaculaceae bacterium]